ncbi:MAG: RsmB/NOP family class I SAM-dependent RNA methyltransferase [Nanoarchaeota archaeon]
MRYEMKPLFEQRIRQLLKEESDFQAFSEIVHKSPLNFIRCNTLKISPNDLKERLEKKWIIKQPFVEHPEIFLIDQNLLPGELGNSIEHVLGYYYVQEISSMMSVLALTPEPGEFILDLCAAPGSKSSQISAKMGNSGTLIANDLKLDRIRILAATLERAGVTNCVITRKDAVALCSHLKKSNYKFDRILLDAPCSGEGTLRSSPKTFITWNEKVVEKMSRIQKKIIANALKCLKKEGVLVYSTCTHAPEENESVVQFALNNFPVKIETLSLPLKCRPGIDEWKGEQFNPEIKKACRIYPQDNDSEGFFVCKMTLLEEIKE